MIEGRVFFLNICLHIVVEFYMIVIGTAACLSCFCL